MGTMGDKGRPDPREGGHTIPQREARRGTMGDQGKQDLGKEDTPSNKGKQEGAHGRPRETRPSGRRTHHPTRETRNKKGCNRRQGETRPLGRRTHRPTKGSKNGHNGRQGETRPPGRRTHHPTEGNKKQDTRQVQWEITPP